MRWARLIGITCLGIGAMVVAATIYAPPRQPPAKPNADLAVSKGAAR